LNFRTSNLFIENGAFLRLKNITVGYTLPEAASNTLKLTRARFYLSGQNLLTFTKYSGLNPELGFNNGGGYSQLNVDYAQYPISKTIILGATITF
jgi:hypothetical protein